MARVRWIEFGREEMLAARERLGDLSQDTIARRIPTSPKTYYRWERHGRVPAASAPAVAAVLGLDLPADFFPSARSNGDALQRKRDDLATKRHREVLIRLDRIAEAVRTLTVRVDADRSRPG